MKQLIYKKNLTTTNSITTTPTNAIQFSKCPFLRFILQLSQKKNSWRVCVSLLKMSNIRILLQFYCFSLQFSLFLVFFFLSLSLSKWQQKKIINFKTQNSIITYMEQSNGKLLSARTGLFLCFIFCFVSLFHKGLMHRQSERVCSMKRIESFSFFCYFFNIETKLSPLESHWLRGGCRSLLVVEIEFCPDAVQPPPPTIIIIFVRRRRSAGRATENQTADCHVGLMFKANKHLLFRT